MSLDPTSNVPVSDDVAQWRHLYTSLSEGKGFNINDILLGRSSVDGIPLSGSDLNGEIRVPKEAGNITAGKQEKAPEPDAYEDTSPVGTSVGINEMGRSHGVRRKRRSTSSRRKTSSGGGVKRKRSRSGGAGRSSGTKRRRRSSGSTKARKRSRITRRK